MDWDGERDLTADEAAAFIEAAGWCWSQEKYPNGWVVYVYRDPGDEREFLGKFGDFESKSYLVALNAACRAIRSKGCESK